MSTNSPWLIVTFTPGLSVVRHRCMVEIARSGQLTQSLFERGAGEWRPVFPHHERLLDNTRLEALRTAVAGIDFARLAARVRQCGGGHDASRLAIEVYQPDSTSVRVDGPILEYDRGYHDFKETFEPAQQFWRVICDSLPERFMDRA